MGINVYFYIAVMATVTFLIRVLPLTIIRKEITNQFMKSFLYYVPYVTISIMTFPAILYATDSQIIGLIALVLGVLAAWVGANLFQVAVLCCLSVLVCQYIANFM